MNPKNFFAELKRRNVYKVWLERAYSAHHQYSVEGITETVPLRSALRSILPEGRIAGAAANHLRSDL